jgi:glycine oxidase
MDTPDILILGAGIVGLSLARELARVRSRVVVLDRGAVGCGSSSAAAGLLSPHYDLAPGGPFVELCRQSAAAYEAWITELRADGAGDVGHRRTGLLHVCTEEAEVELLRGYLADHVAPDQRAEWLPASELRHREPALSTAVLGAAFYPDVAHVDPPRLVQQVARVAALAGVSIRENEPVRQIEKHGDRITALHTTSGSYHPDIVILTAGAWTGELAGMLGLHLPTRPVKGQMLLAHCRVPPVQTPLHAGEALLVPWPDGRLALGATLEEVGFDDRVRLESLCRILQRTIALVPAVGGLAFDRAWAGLRPATPDGHPYMGPVPPLHNLWVSAGHFRKGTLLAPLCARLLAASILSGHPVEELAPFKPTRRMAS